MKNKEKRNITIREFNRLKALGILGLIDTDQDPRTRAERLVFVNNIDTVYKDLLNEYNLWYHGDGSELLNFFTRANAIDFNYDPLFQRNKKSYFWAISSTEGDMKRTHSGQPRNIVDSLNGIIGAPQIGVGKPNAVLSVIDKRLKRILRNNRFDHLLTQKARPLTFVEGWGAWKINWNKEFSDTPVILYYRADAVDFVYKSNQLVAIIYRDYYQDADKKNYVLFETRRLEKREIKSGENAGKVLPCLIIEKEAYKMSGTSDILNPCELKDIPQLKDVEPEIMIENFDRLLGAPNIYFDDASGDLPGRSLYTGKLDLFDDLDQCLSQAANSVRRSTPTEVWDVNYLERDKNTGMPIMPHAYDRKYISFRGARSGDGSVNNNPVQTTQPQINFSQYSDQAVQILLQIINGIMAPATLGIDVAKKDNGESQREKEKVTIFTRNLICREEEFILRDLMEQVLIADELMNYQKVTCTDYDIYIKYEEFADASFENKIETVATALQASLMTDELAVQYLYKDSISAEQKKDLINFMKEQREKSEQMPYSDEELGEMGAELGGNNNNPHNLEAKKAQIDTVQEDLGVPELGQYEKTHDRKQESDVEKMLG